MLVLIFHGWICVFQCACFVSISVCVFQWVLSVSVCVIEYSCMFQWVSLCFSTCIFGFVGNWDVRHSCSRHDLSLWPNLQGQICSVWISGQGCTAACHPMVNYQVYCIVLCCTILHSQVVEGNLHRNLLIVWYMTSMLGNSYKWGHNITWINTRGAMDLTYGQGWWRSFILAHSHQMAGIRNWYALGLVALPSLPKIHKTLCVVHFMELWCLKFG